MRQTQLFLLLVSRENLLLLQHRRFPDSRYRVRVHPRGITREHGIAVVLGAARMKSSDSSAGKKRATTADAAPACNPLSPRLCQGQILTTTQLNYMQAKKILFLPLNKHRRHSEFGRK